MNRWRDRRILDLFGIELPIIQAPMAGVDTPDMAIAVSEAGGLGSLASAQLTVDQARKDLATIRRASQRPINVNFFAHKSEAANAAQMAAWRALMAPYYRELGLDADAPVPLVNRAPFDDGFAALVEETKPEVVSFHFGLPEQRLLDRVRATGAKIISSATTVAEAHWLEQRGIDAIIAMGFEAGGHRGNFLSDDMGRQVGTMALVPQIVDAVSVPMIAAGGIADARGVAAALALGASGVQIGTAYLRCPEAHISELHRAALKKPKPATVITNVLTGRPARAILNCFIAEQGPVSAETPAFPLATQATIPLRTIVEKQGSGDFSSFWSGEARSLGRDMNAEDLTRTIAEESLALLRGPSAAK